jgi:hypothetical protein
MTTFLVEVYVPTTELSRVEIKRVARTLARGRGVRHLRSIFVPQDETCFHLVNGPSAEAVGTAVLSAAIRFERVVEAVQVCADRSAPGKEEER